MSRNPPSLPACSRLLSSYELTAHLRNAKLLALSADKYADTLRSENGDDAQQERKNLQAEASRHRELLWSVRPGDRVWLTLGSPPHPECDFGASYLVVVRAGKVVLWYRVSQWMHTGAFVPILPTTLRLTHDEVISIACEWVRRRYPVVPPVARVLEFSEQSLFQIEQACGHRFESEEREQCVNQWRVNFVCSWDTDKLGLPQRISLVIDDLTGDVKPE